jgi:hypothetical protein
MRDKKIIFYLSQNSIHLEDKNMNENFKLEKYDDLLFEIETIIVEKFAEDPIDNDELIQAALDLRKKLLPKSLWRSGASLINIKETNRLLHMVQDTEIEKGITGMDCDLIEALTNFYLVFNNIKYDQEIVESGLNKLLKRLDEK